MLLQPDISTGMIGHLACMQALPITFLNNAGLITNDDSICCFQVREGFDSELTPLRRWLYERKQFNLIFGTTTFAKFR